MKLNSAVFILSLGLFLVFFMKTCRCTDKMKIRSPFRSTGTTTRSELKRLFLNEILNSSNYDPRIPPYRYDGSDGGIMVFTNIFVRRISSVNDLKQEMSIEMTFRQQWNDSRLAFHSDAGGLRYLTLNEPNIIWQPDIFFTNEIESHSHNLLKPNLYFRIFSSGEVLHSTRISVKLSCWMDFQYFPMDYQVCRVRLASYAYTEDDIILLWKKYDPVQIVRNLNSHTLSYFNLKKFGTGICSSITNTGIYSCLEVDLFFQRNLRPFLREVYIPSCMLVILSWVSFWIDPKAFNSRFLLSFICLLSMFFHSTGIQSTIPVTSYIKAIDVWTGVSIAFLFGNVIEIILLNHYFKKQDDAKSRNENTKNESTIRRWFRSNNTFEKWEKFTIISYPLGFLGFNLIYWISYLTMDDSNVSEHLQTITSYS